MTGPATRLTEDAIRSACESIRSDVDAFDREGALDSLLRAQRAIETLRGQYRQDPVLFRPHVGALSALGGEVRTRLQGAARLLVRRLFQAREAVSAARAEEAALRDAILEICRASGTARVEIAADELLLQAKRVTTFRVPKASSEAYGQLVRLLEDAQVMAGVSRLSSAKLGEALEKGSLPAPLGDAVKALCTSATTYRMSVSASRPGAPRPSPPSSSVRQEPRPLGLPDEPEIPEEQEVDDWVDDAARSGDERWSSPDEDEAEMNPEDDEGSGEA